MEGQSRIPGQKPVAGQEPPPDFANRIATKIIFTNERERDQEAALEKIGELLLRNLSQPNRVRFFAEAIEILENDDETARFASLSWVSLVIDRGDDPRYEKFVSDILDSMIEDHMQAVKPPYQLEYRRKHFSYFARNRAEVFIAMMNMNSEMYEVVNEIYATLIRKEMAIESGKKDRRESVRRITLAGQRDDDPKVGKKLFDDVVDYIHARGEQRSGTLNQTNPNEFIAVLADRMRGTRRYVIQDILNRQALQRRKEAEKELSERLASAEEIILAKDAFKRGVRLFWTEKQYNFKFLAVEKVRVTVQVFSVIVGILYFLAGYLGLFGMLWWEGLTVAAGMYLFARFFCSRQFFRRFFPEDVSKELEVVVGSFTPTFRKMSKEQLDAFLVRQVKDPENFHHLMVFPEFLKYVFAVMPDRRNVLVQREDLADVLQNMEMDMARVMRTGSPHMAPL